MIVYTGVIPKPMVYVYNKSYRPCIIANVNKEWMLEHTRSSSVVPELLIMALLAMTSVRS